MGCLAIEEAVGARTPGASQRRGTSLTRAYASQGMRVASRVEHLYVAGDQEAEVELTKLLRQLDEQNATSAATAGPTRA